MEKVLNQTSEDWLTTLRDRRLLHASSLLLYNFGNLVVAGFIRSAVILLPTQFTSSASKLIFFFLTQIFSSIFSHSFCHEQPNIASLNFCTISEAPFSSKGIFRNHVLPQGFWNVVVMHLERLSLIM